MGYGLLTNSQSEMLEALIVDSDPNNLPAHHVGVPVQEESLLMPHTTATFSDF